MVFAFTLISIIGATFSMDEMTMRFKDNHAKKNRIAYKEKVVDYRHMLLVRKYARIKYLCAMILRQKNI